MAAGQSNKAVNDWQAVDASDWQDVTPGSPAPLSRPDRSVGGFAGNVLSSAGNFVSNTVGALTSPKQTLSAIGAIPVGIYEKMGGPTPESWGKPGERQAEQQLDAIGGFYKDRYGSPSKIVDTLYTDPVGVAADVSAVAGGVAPVLKAVGLPRAASAVNAVSQAANPLVGAPRAITKAIPASARNHLAKRMYQGGLKPPPGGSFSKQEIDAMVETGLNEKIPVSGGGLSKTRGKIDDINQTVSGKIADGAAAGKTVDPVKVAAETQRSEKAFTTVDPADKEPIAGVRDRFLEKNSNQYKYTKVRPAAEDATGYVPEGQGVTKEPRPIPVDEAQKLKSNTYRDIRESYGEQSSAVREAKKDLARGLKEGIYEHYPELRTLGKQEKVLIDLENALERFSNRHGNRDVVSVGGPLKVLAATAMGHPGTGLVGAALEMPGIKSRLAIALKASTRAQRSAARGRQITNAVTRETAATEQQ